MLVLFLLACVGLQAWAWARLRRRVRDGRTTKLRALSQYAGWALAPLALVVGLLLGAIGIEEASGRALIAEPWGRAALPAAAVLLAVGVVGVLAFSVQVALLRRGGSGHGQERDKATTGSTRAAR
jgi:hypothetical protein